MRRLPAVKPLSPLTKLILTQIGPPPRRSALRNRQQQERGLLVAGRPFALRFVTSNPPAALGAKEHLKPSLAHDHLRLW